MLYAFHPGRFHQVIIHASLECSLSAFIAFISRHGHYGKFVFCGPDYFRGLEPIHFRHKQVHEKHIVFLLFHLLNGLGPILHNIYLITNVLENGLCNLLVDQIILGQKDGKFFR